MATALDLALGGDKAAVVASTVGGFGPIGVRVIVDDQVVTAKADVYHLLETIRQVLVEAAWPYGTGGKVGLPDGFVSFNGAVLAFDGAVLGFRS